MPAAIFMYHDLAKSVAKVPTNHRPYVLNPQVFDRQLQIIKEKGSCVLNLTEWVANKYPGRAVVLTFDDGHISNYEEAFPILQKHSLKATFFITAGEIGKGSTMNWDQIIELHRAGMEIGSHTLTHRPPSTLSDDELWYELTESKKVLEDGLGSPVTSISSPTGFFNPRMSTVAKAAGYKALCFGMVGYAQHEGEPFRIERISIKNNLKTDDFRRLVGFDSDLVRKMRKRQRFRNFGKQVLTPGLYLKLRSLLMRYASIAGRKSAQFYRGVS